MADKNVIWSNDVDELWGDEDYQRESYEADIESGLIDESYPFEDWLEDFYKDYDAMSREAEYMAEDYEMSIESIIKKQADSIPDANEWGATSPIFLIGNRSGWRAGSGGMAFDNVKEFSKWLLQSDYDNSTEIQNDNGNMYLVSYDHDGTTVGTLYTLPTTKEGMLAFIKNCTIYPDEIEDYRDEFQEGMTDDEILWELFYSDAFGSQYDISWRETTKYPEYLEPVKVVW